MNNISPELLKFGMDPRMMEIYEKNKLFNNKKTIELNDKTKTFCCAAVKHANKKKNNEDVQCGKKLFLITKFI